jgi:hypothetical protein
MNNVDVINASLGVNFADELQDESGEESEIDLMQLPEVIPMVDVTEFARVLLVSPD